MAKKETRRRRKQEPQQTVRVEVIQPQSTAIVPAPAPPNLAETAEAALKFAEQQIYFRDQLLKLIAKTLPKNEVYVYATGKVCTECNGAAKPDDYCPSCRRKTKTREKLDPYLSGNACRLVLANAGVETKEPEMSENRYEGSEGPYIIFEQTITAVARNGRSVSTIGSGSTLDDFFSKRWRWDEEQRKRVPYRLPLGQVNIRNVRLKAMTHSLNRAVRDLGFMPTAEHFASAGVELSKLRRIQFGRGGDEEVASDRLQATSTQPPASGQEAGAKSGAASPSPKRDAAVPEQSKTNKKPSDERKEPPKGKPHTPSEKSQGAPGNAGSGALHSDGIVREVQKRTRGGSSQSYRRVRIVNNDRQDVYLFCFDNKKMDEKGGTMFSYLDKYATDAFCRFMIKTSPNTTDPEHPYLNIIGAVQIGMHEWLEDGTPVLRRDPPGREPGDESEFHATDEDLPESLR